MAASKLAVDVGGGGGRVLKYESYNEFIAA